MRSIASPWRTCCVRSLGMTVRDRWTWTLPRSRSSIPRGLRALIVGEWAISQRGGAGPFGSTLRLASCADCSRSPACSIVSA